MVGRVPRGTAEEVFDVVLAHLGPLIRRLPDGEQAGWLTALKPRFADSPALEPSSRVPYTNAQTPFRNHVLSTYRLRSGADPTEVDLGPFPLAESQIASYAIFSKLKSAGRVPPHVRFQATMPGPLTIGSSIDAPLDAVLAMVEKPMTEEIDRLLAAIPASDLAIQLDLAVEAEIEEFRRRPDEIDMPFLQTLSSSLGAWTLDGIVDSVARLCSRIPPEVELGFHLCAAWHIDFNAGQDVRVHVDLANLLHERVPRPISYVHIPTTPEFDKADFERVSELEIPKETSLYLGIIHSTDGKEGSQRRLRAAESALAREFGVAHFCGLGPLFGVQATDLETMLRLHRQLAEDRGPAQSTSR
jgi:hypothetical protein